MELIRSVLRIMDLSMEKPGLYGWFHILSLILTVLATAALCYVAKRQKNHNVPATVLTITLITIVLELYKQVNYSFSYDGAIGFDYQWYAFPWQFCSTPMYVGLLAGLTRKGKLHESLCAYLATYAMFAGVCVMVYPATVFISTIGINIQTMFCHGSMIVVGIYLLHTGYVKLEHKTILKALPVFAVMMAIAMIGNEIAKVTGLLERETFNMFFISPYCEPSLPVYSLIQGVLPYPVCLVIYFCAFSLAGYIMLLLGMLVKNLAQKKQAAKVS